MKIHHYLSQSQVNQVELVAESDCDTYTLGMLDALIPESQMCTPTTNAGRRSLRFAVMDLVQLALQRKR